jgi:Zn-finger nucleic acid-binding protein
MACSCPVCRVDLVGKIYDGVTFTECPQCAGVWFFEDDLKHLESENVQDLGLVDLMDVPIQPAGSPSDALVCPMCGQAMGQFHFMADSPILLHRCASCEGLWIEHGKLTQMAAAIEAAQKPPTSEEIALAGNAALAGSVEQQPIGAASQPADGTAPRTESAVEISFDREHAATMERYHAVTAVCRLLSFRIPWPL